MNASCYLMGSHLGQLYACFASCSVGEVQTPATSHVEKQPNRLPHALLSPPHSYMINHSENLWFITLHLQPLLKAAQWYPSTIVQPWSNRVT